MLKGTFYLYYFVLRSVTLAMAVGHKVSGQENL